MGRWHLKVEVFAEARLCCFGGTKLLRSMAGLTLFVLSLLRWVAFDVDMAAIPRGWASGACV